MKGYGMLCAGVAGWIDADKPKVGPMDAIIRPTAVAPCTNGIHIPYSARRRGRLQRQDTRT